MTKIIGGLPILITITDNLFSALLKSDFNVHRLLQTREDIFPGYTQEAFESEFSRVFSIQDCANIRNSERSLHVMLSSEVQA